MARILAFAAFLLMIIASPAAHASWWNADWAHRMKITLDTSKTGVPLAADVGSVPVVIRLHAGNFSFLDTREDGADLRFIGPDDHTPLPFHIESYDWVNEIGIAWVQIPKLGGADGTPYIWLYYGNPHAVAAGDSKTTYDADQTLVYHFAAKNPLPQDATAYGNKAKFSTAGLVSNGYMDRAEHFDGAARIVIPAAPALKTAPGGGFTFSAWLKPEAPKPATGTPATQPAAPETPARQAILTRQDAQASFSVALEDSQVIVRLKHADGTEAATPAGARLAAGDWHFLSVSVGDQVSVMIDGQEAASIPARMPALDGDIVLGAPPGDPAKGGFVGLMDEVQLSRTARPAPWLKLAALGQGPDTKLLSYDTSAQSAGGGGEYLAIITLLLGSVTVDGWVVIALIFLLGFVSFEVMIGKALALRRTVRADARFLTAFREPDADLMGLDAADTAVDDWELSPAYAVYSAGVREARRVAATESGKLSGLGFEVIRSAIDSTLLAEINTLSRRMVLVTLAVSGAPFLGLLGTVMGIMITFATIALKGDVNINTIAPGIAAALCATAAGMAVAIPALFGYNVLQTRIRDVTGVLDNFREELLARFAVALS
jgi:biopolymer transport protein ExbB